MKVPRPVHMPKGSDDPLKRAGVVGQKCHGQFTC
jgi:hypothetical protein